MSIFEEAFRSQMEMYNQQALQRQLPLGGGLLGNLGLAGMASSANIPQQPVVPRPAYKPILTFIQTLRNEIDEWLKI